MERQGFFTWGDVYTPSTLAVPREAPKGSRISRLNSRKLGRTLHVLSTPERVFTQLALHHPALLDLHEQKMLWPVTACNPLYGHPLTREAFPAPMPGTLEIAEAIGFKHYEIVLSLPDGHRERTAFPYQGDLLLYLVRTDGTPYAINWTVKDEGLSFGERRRSQAKTPVQQRIDREHAVLRARLETQYYAGAGIQTVQVSMDMLEPTVIANLDLLFPMHGLPSTLDAGVLDEFSIEVQKAVLSGEPTAQLAIRYGRRWGSLNQFIARIYQDIWERKLPVSLFHPILIDHPLVVGKTDLLLELRSLFGGAAL